MDLDAMMKEMGIDPSDLDAMNGNMDEVMKMMAEMSPEDLAKQMQDAMDLFSGDDMMANMLGNQDEILAMLEETGAVDAEELAKFKADPEYFEQKMKESMDELSKKQRQNSTNCTSFPFGTFFLVFRRFWNLVF